MGTVSSESHPFIGHPVEDADFSTVEYKNGTEIHTLEREDESEMVTQSVRVETRCRPSGSVIQGARR